MAVNPNTNFTAGAVLTADQQNRFPRGVMAYSRKVGTTGITTSIGDVGVSVTFTAVADRYYKYTYYCYATDSTSASTQNTVLTDNSNNVLASNNTYVPGGAQYNAVIFIEIRTETAGSVTRKMRAQTSAGAGSLFGPMFLLVEDIGPA